MCGLFSFSALFDHVALSAWLCANVQRGSGSSVTLDPIAGVGLGHAQLTLIFPVQVLANDGCGNLRSAVDLRANPIKQSSIS